MARPSFGYGEGGYGECAYGRPPSTPLAAGTVGGKGDLLDPYDPDFEPIPGGPHRPAMTHSPRVTTSSRERPRRS